MKKSAAICALWATCMCGLAGCGKGVKPDDPSNPSNPANSAGRPISCRPSAEPCTGPCEPTIGGHQGPFLEGNALDGLHFKLVGTGNVWPPQAGVTLKAAAICSVPNLNLQVKIKDCVPGVADAVACRVDVVTGDGICGTPKDPGPCRTYEEKDQDSKHNRGVLVVQGFWDKKGAWNADSDIVTLSCYDDINEHDQHRWANGAIARCLGKDYSPSKNADEFLACIRLLRADYCGDGDAHTFSGTDVDMHDPSNPVTPPECQDGRCFEASWSKEGAVCIARPRWKERGLGACDTKFGQPDPKGIRCRNPKPAELVFSRSQINSCTSDPAAANCPAGGDADPHCP